MDVELLFSRNPFVQQSGGQFASIRPNATADGRSCPEQAADVRVRLPEAVPQQRTCWSKSSAAARRKSQAYYANAMDVQMIENYGQVQVPHGDDGKPLPKVYVKVYARLPDGR